MRTYASKRKMKYELSDTLLIYGEIDKLIEDMKEEARRVEVVDYDITLDHSEIYIRSGDEIYLSMLGTYPRLVESMPKMCKFVSVCLFKLVTDKIIKKYTRKRL